MEILELINSYIEYAYILLGLIIIFLLIKLLVILNHIGKLTTPIKEDVSNIKIYGDEIKEKSAIIDNTMKTSVPFFLSIFTGISIVVGTIQDYFDTKPSRRSIKKSAEKAYRYRNCNDTAFNAFTRKASSILKQRG